MLIHTILGELEEETLEKREGVVDTEVEYTTWKEWWYQGQLVKRSAHVTIKETAKAGGEIGG
jgi:hypothetical protein